MGNKFQNKQRIKKGTGDQCTKHVTFHLTKLPVKYRNFLRMRISRTQVDTYKMTSPVEVTTHRQKLTIIRRRSPLSFNEGDYQGHKGRRMDLFFEEVFKQR